MAKAKALYDFQGNAEQNELSFSAGDEVTIIRQDIGDGWWEGEANGQSGLFPESYVELEGAGAAGEFSGDEAAEWDEGEDGDQEWDDGGDDDEPQASRPAPPPSAASSSKQPPRAPVPVASGGGAASSERTTTMKRNVNRFSAFVKAGAEGFMMGTAKKEVLDKSAYIYIVDNAGPEWAANPQPYGEIRIEKAGSRSKFMKMKTYEAYTISGGGSDVERRHKHFVWLHERLTNKYSCICVPPLPDKQFMSKYGETFLDKRQQKLHDWINRIVRHPILSQDRLSLHHFLTTTDAKAWKNGKRDAEKDHLIGANFFKVIQCQVECPKDAVREITNFDVFLKDMEKAVKRSMDVATGHAARSSGAIRAEFKKVAGSFTNLGEVFGKPGDGDSVKLSMALAKAGIAYDVIAEMWGDQPKYDQVAFIDGLKEYGAMLTQFTDAIVSSKEAAAKVEELSHVQPSPSADQDKLDRERDVIAQRAQTIEMLTLCEIRHFHNQRRADFKKYMSAYIVAQIEFHDNIANKLRDALSEFDRLDF